MLFSHTALDVVVVLGLSSWVLITYWQNYKLRVLTRAMATHLTRLQAMLIESEISHSIAELGYRNAESLQKPSKDTDSGTT
jgi:hypothetical protein